jgi:hypothetical protein
VDLCVLIHFALARYCAHTSRCVFVCVCAYACVLACLLLSAVFVAWSQGYNEEGALMMEVLLQQRSVVVGADGYTDQLARATLEILMGEGE